MTLSTLSGFLDFAIQGEKDNLDFLHKASKEFSKEILEKCKLESEKNRKAFQAILRENITELVMEPYESLDEKSFFADFDEKAPVQSVLLGLEKQRDFLREAAKLVNLREVKRALEKIAQKKDHFILEIKQVI